MDNARATETNDKADARESNMDNASTTTWLYRFTIVMTLSGYRLTTNSACKHTTV